LFKVPQEAIENIELTLPITYSIDQVKREIEKKHPLKPRPSKQKFFFAGKLLSTSTDTLRDILSGVMIKDLKQFREISMKSRYSIFNSTKKCLPLKLQLNKTNTCRQVILKQTIKVRDNNQGDS